MIYQRNQRLTLLEIIRVLADYVILNAPAINSSGLFNGRSGISLVLFESSRLLSCNRIEDAAFELLEQALLSRTTDILFTNGLSGIGYALNYLIQNQFVSANYMEIFGRQHNYIVEKYQEVNLKDVKISDLIKYYDLNFYFKSVKDRRSEMLLSRNNAYVYAFFQEVWNNVLCWEKKYDLERILNLWRKLLANTYFTESKYDLKSLYLYLKCIDNGVLKVDLSSLYYIALIALKFKEHLLKFYVNRIKKKCAKYDYYSIEIIDKINLFTPPFLTMSRTREYLFDSLRAKSIKDLEFLLSEYTEGSQTRVGLCDGVSKVLLALLFISSPNPNNVVRINEITAFI